MREVKLDLKTSKQAFNQNWERLRKIGQTKFVNSMYIWIFIVPLVAKSFEFLNKDILRFKIFGEDVAFNTGLPFSWQVFYFSALFFAIANIIIRLRCPMIIKDHLTFQSFIGEGKTIKQLGVYSEDISFDWARLAEEIDKKITALQVAKSVDNGGVADNYEKLSTEDPVHYFSPIFDQANYMYKHSRYACTISFTIGAVLFGWVILENTIVVIQFIFK